MMMYVEGDGGETCYFFLCVLRKILLDEYGGYTPTKKRKQTQEAHL